MQVGSTARIASQMSGCSYQQERETTRRVQDVEERGASGTVGGCVHSGRRNEVLITEPPPDPAILLLGVRPKEMESGSQNDVSVPMRIETRFTGAKKQKQPSCLLMHERVESRCCLRPATQRKTRKVLPCAAPGPASGRHTREVDQAENTVLREAPPCRL